MGWRDTLRFSLSSTLGSIFKTPKKREEILEEIEEQLILADVSVDLASRLTKNLRKRLPGQHDKESYLKAIQEEIVTILQQAAPRSSPKTAKEVWLLVGINGCGKTTSAAKLALHFHQRGKKVLLCAADTFRAAGSTQLNLWGEKLGFPVIAGDRGSDSGAAVYQGLQIFSSKEYDLLIIDTAGRVQTKENLMKELEKTTKIVKKFFDSQPAETLLVLDAATGQNAVTQAELFSRFSGITGLLLTKMDGTAKGGTVLSIVDRMQLPVRFIGTGEGENDLCEFSTSEFASLLFSNGTESR